MLAHLNKILQLNKKDTSQRVILDMHVLFLNFFKPNSFIFKCLTWDQVLLNNV